MDQALEERSLGSAPSPRRKMQEREQERQQRREVMAQEARERRIIELLEDSSDEGVTDDENDGATASYSTSEPELDDTPSIRTPSDRSPLTPDEFHLPAAIKRKKPRLNLSGKTTGRIPQLQISVHDGDSWMPVDKAFNRPPPSPVPMLQSSLVTLSDWNYERFSAVLDPAVVKDFLAGEDDEEPYSPMEIATPILYSQPKVRPSVISICNILTRQKPSIPLMRSPVATEKGLSATDYREVPRKASGRVLHISQQSAFLASEATEFRVPDSPKPAQSTSLNVSHGTRAHNTLTMEKAHERAPSAPLLTVSSRVSHIAQLALPTRPSIGIIEQQRPRSAMSDVLSTSSGLSSPLQPFEPGRISRTFSAQTDPGVQRPILGHRTNSMLSQEISDVVPSHTSKPSALQIARKKSFSALRSRSESIGQALKSVKAKGRLSIRPDTSVPPVPVLGTPKPTQSLDLNSFPVPPPPSLRTASSNVSFSPRPPSQSVGLGLSGM